jgi:hypothetical protein
VLGSWLMKSAKKCSSLVGVLWAEVFQTEESAFVQPKREARRLEGAPPAAAMLAVSQHAEAGLDGFRRLAENRGYKRAKAGKVIGRLFSKVRHVGTDLLISSEKSYRATILGIRHGIGVVLLLEDAAVASGDQELADYCAEWLAVRGRLAENVESELSWFAENPELAMTRALPWMALMRA